MDDLADVLNALAPTLRERVFPTIRDFGVVEERDLPALEPQIREHVAAGPDRIAVVLVVLETPRPTPDPWTGVRP
jgi:hypothetical protein